MAYLRFNGAGVTVQLLGRTTNLTYNPPLNENYELPNGNYDITIIAQDGVTIQSVSYIDPDFGSESFFTITDNGKKANKSDYPVYNWTSDVFTITTTGSSGGGTGSSGDGTGSSGDGTGSSGDGTGSSGGGTLQGFTNLYLVDRNVLKSIASEDLVKTWGEPETKIRVDLRDYIINVLELPFSIPSDLIGNDLPIKLGEYELTTKAKEIKQDLLFLDLGNITVPFKYNNSFDFMDTTVKLYLPFIDVITLDVDYVINQEIHIQYIIDLFSGDTTINIESSKTGKNIYSNNYKLGRNIPFNAKNNVIVNRLSDMEGLHNGVFTPYIEVIRNKINNLNEFNNMVDVENILVDEKGFIIVNEIELKTSATSNEKNSIIQLLKNGVYIK